MFATTPHTSSNPDGVIIGIEGSVKKEIGPAIAEAKVGSHVTQSEEKVIASANANVHGNGAQ